MRNRGFFSLQKKVYLKNQSKLSALSERFVGFAFLLSQSLVTGASLPHLRFKYCGLSSLRHIILHTAALVFIIVGGTLGFCYRAVKINVTGIIQLEAVGYNIISRSGLVADALQL